MNKLLLAFLIGLSPFANTPKRVFIHSEVDHVVYLETDIGRCTGSVVASPTGETLVLTAAHCVLEGGKAWAMFDDGVVTELDVVYVGTPGSREDVALLRGDTHGAKPAPLAMEVPLPSACFMFGFAGTKTEMMLPCMLIADYHVWGIGGIAETRKGDSGGPVYGLNGELVGVIWGADPENPYDLIIAPVESVWKALGEMSKKQQPE